MTSLSRHNCSKSFKKLHTRLATRMHLGPNSKQTLFDPPAMMLPTCWWSTCTKACAMNDPNHYRLDLQHVENQSYNMQVCLPEKGLERYLANHHLAVKVNAENWSSNSRKCYNYPYTASNRHTYSESAFSHYHMQQQKDVSKTLS